jgi:hypothetical protein
MRAWTAKSAVARCVRNLDGAIERLRKCSIEWADVDTHWELEFEQRIGEIEVLRDELRKEIDERLAAGEHIGL